MLTPEAKKRLAEAIRGSAQDPEKGLRARLLRSLHDEAERRYRLAVPIDTAGLDEGPRKRRARLEAWLDERARATKPKTKAELTQAKARLLAQAEKEAAATFLNRVVLLRQLEAHGLSKPLVLTGGWNSLGYRDLRAFAPGLTTDDTEGFATLLQLIFDELAVDLPGVFGDIGLTRLFPIPPAMLRDTIETLDDPALASAWTDDTTLGWVYQYWNDPDREALDAKINDGGKIAPHEIASKTQMFTERYMVEWLLANSLGLTWLAMCKRNGWTADAERVLPVLEARRQAFREARDAGQVPLDALMPIEGELEAHWKYYVPQPIPEDAIARAPDSVKALRILDPACGSGHFLVIAFDMLVALYREEARHRGETITDERIATSILENNLFGIDIDPRATQIAAAALYLKAKSLAKGARPKRVNLVAPVLALGNLPKDDPAIVELREDLEREVGIPAALTDALLTALAGVDYLGSLLKVDAAMDDAILGVELAYAEQHGQGDLFTGAFPTRELTRTAEEAKASILARLEVFLGRHTNAEDLGLRLDGEQLAAGVRFVRIAKEASYDIVVGNPPYQGLAKTASFDYVTKTYPKGKADLYAAFLERGLQLAREGGISAMVTMRGWMFLGQFEALRKQLLTGTCLQSIADLGTGAFSSRSMDDVISTALAISIRIPPGHEAVAIQAGPISDPRRDAGKPTRREAALLAGVGRFEFDPRGFEVIEGEPIVYWWSKAFLAEYAAAPKLHAQSPGRFGLTTGDNGRFVRFWFEVRRMRPDQRWATTGEARDVEWAPFVLGGKGRTWFEPLRDCVRWSSSGLEVKEKCISQYGTVSKQIRNESFYFRRGIAFAMIGSSFSARSHRFPSIIGNMGSSVYPIAEFDNTLAFMNSSRSRFILSSINPGVHFEVGDVNRLSITRVPDAEQIAQTMERSFAEHEASREGSFEFRRPGTSPWDAAERWAQLAVDRAPGEPLPPYEPVYEPPAPSAFISFALGVALGRFGANGEGILDAAPEGALPAGLLFVTSASEHDSLKHPACAPLLAAWETHRADAAPDYEDLGDYLRRGFFAAVHKPMYENRPIYLPLSSAKKSFVAYASIHRFRDDTLSVLLADHLLPTKRALEGEREDLRVARVKASNKAKAERRYVEVQKLLEELEDFIAKVSEVADEGAPPTDEKCTKREVDARFTMDLDDGVMINSAGLWPLLDPQWKDPKKWWRELAMADGKKDYDWSHLAARYFPARVRAKCAEDPSLAVAHGCFWALHPAKAYAWELRLQDEIRADFTIDEVGSDEARAAFLVRAAGEAEAGRAAEMKRRARKGVREEGLFEGEE